MLPALSTATPLYELKYFLADIEELTGAANSIKSSS